MIAFSCEPGRGSEPGVGWEFARALARLAQVDGVEARLYTRPHTVAAVRTALDVDSLTQSLEVVAVPVPIALRRVFGKKALRVEYVIWQLRLILSLNRVTRPKDSISIVHHVTFATEGLPTFEHHLASDYRRVFGPVGSAPGLALCAMATAPNVSRRLRIALRRLFGHFNAKFAVLVATNSDTASTWPRVTGVFLEPNIMVPDELVLPLRQRYSKTIDIVIAGQLIPRKRVDLALRAVQSLNPHLKVVVIGDGPESDRIKALADNLVLADITFAGELSRLATLEYLAQARVLLHTSSQEGASWVVGEAQSLGAVPVVVAGSGTESTIALGHIGVIAKTSSEADIVVALEDALRQARAVTPSNRWLSSRMPELLREWYRTAMDIPRERLL